MLGFEEKTVCHWPRLFCIFPFSDFHWTMLQISLSWWSSRSGVLDFSWEKVSSRGHLSAPAPPAVQRNTWTQLKEIPSTQLKEICSTQLTKRSEKYKDWGNDATQGRKTDEKLRKNEGTEHFMLIFLQHENRIVLKKSWFPFFLIWAWLVVQGVWNCGVWSISIDIGLGTQWVIDQPTNLVSAKVLFN